MFFERKFIWLLAVDIGCLAVVCLQQTLLPSCEGPNIDQQNTKD